MNKITKLEIELAEKIIMLKGGSLVEAREHLLNATDLIIKGRGVK